MRIRIFVLIFAALAAHTPADDAGAASIPGALLWSASGPERFPASREIPLDAAARLTVAREYGGAFDELEGTIDSLRAGIVACYADRYAEAVALLGSRIDNPYLDWLRRYYRALALRKEERPREAIADLDSFFVLVDRLAVHPRGSVGAAARDLLIDVAARDDSLWSARQEILDIEEITDGRVRLVVAKAYLDRGLDSLAVATFLGGPVWLVPESSSQLFADLFARMRPYLAEAPSRSLQAFASRALSDGSIDEAEGVVKLLLSMDDTDSETLLLEARLLAARGDRRGAIDRFRLIAASGTSEKARAEAIRRAAEIEHRLGDLDAAVAGYLTLADDFGDRRMLDRAARIEMLRGNYDSALELWMRHGTSHTRRNGDVADTAIYPDVGIDQAALLHFLSRDAEAYTIVERTPGGDSRTEAGLLYWLSVTGPSDSVRADAAAGLARRFPLSLYAAALEDGTGLPEGPTDSDERRSRLDRLLAAEWAFIDSLAAASPPESWLDRHPAHEAYRWALDCGFVAEAAEFLLAVERTEVAGAAEALTLYREARERGCYDFAIWILNRRFAEDIPGSARERLRHPIAFASILSNDEIAAGISPELILAVMYAESKFARSAVSRSGAVGVMQLMPSTARWFTRKRGWGGGSCRDLNDPVCNIRIGSHYLSYLLDRADGSLIGALAAYNAGDGRMAEWKKRFDPVRNPMVALELISPAETAEYVKNVLDAFRFYRILAAGRHGTP